MSTLLSSRQSSPMGQPPAQPWRSETPDEIYARAVERESRDCHADAADLYQEAAIRGHLSAMVALGRHLIGLDDRTSVGWFRAAAERGHPTAWTELGHMYARGYGVERSDPHAVMCWQRGAALGDNAARSCLGLSYIQGFGVEKDADRGINIVKEIADAGDVISMRNLAWVYRTGRGVSKDIAQADYWDARAAKAAGSSDGSTKPQLHPPTVSKPVASPKQTEQVSTVPEIDAEQLDETLDTAEPELPPPDTDVAPTHEEQSVETPREPEVDVTEPVAPTQEEPEPIAIASYSVAEPATVGPESAVQDLGIPQHKPQSSESDTREALNASDDPADESTPRKPSSSSVGSSAKSFQPGVTYLKLVPISSQQETTYLATETSETNLDEDSHPVIAVVKSPTIAAASESEGLGRRPSRVVAETGNLEALEERPATRSPDSKRTVSQISMPSKGSFWRGSSPGPDLGPMSGLEVAESALTRIQSSSSKGSLGRTSFSIPHVRVSEIYASGIYSSAEFEGPGFSVVEEHPIVREVEETPIRRLFSPDENLIDSTPKSIPVAEPAAPEIKPIDNFASASSSDDAPAEEDDDDKQPSALDFARQTIKRHSQGSLNVEQQKAGAVEKPVAASSDHRQPVGRLIAHIEEQEKRKLEKPSGPPPPPPPPPMKPRPPPDVESQPMSQRTAPPVPPPPKPSEPEPEKEPLGLMDEIKDSLQKYPKSPTDSSSRQAVYNFVDAVQRLRADDKKEGLFLVRNRSWDLVVVSMFAQPHDVVIQERSLHALIRLLRFIPEDAKEAAVLRSCDECFSSVGFGNLKVPIGVGRGEPGALQSVLFAMKMYPSTRLVQMAGCAAIADLAEVSADARISSVELGAIVQIAVSLEQRDGNMMSTVYEMACRAISGICAGPDLVSLKQEMAEQRIVEQVIDGLNRWMSRPAENDNYLLFATRSGCAALRHLCTLCMEASRHALNSNAFVSLMRALDVHKKDSATCTIAIAAIIAIASAAGDLAEDILEDSEILGIVLATMMDHSSDALLVRKALMCIETLGAYKKLQKRAVEEGAIAVTVDIAGEHEDPRVQEQACSTIERLSHYCTPGKDAVASTNAMGVISRAMLLYPDDSGVMERAALAACSTCTNHPVNQNSALQLGIANPIVHALGKHGSESDKLVIACSTAITALAQAKDPLMGRKMAREEAPEFLVTAIQNHIESADVVEHAAYALATLCVADPTLAAKLSDQGVEKTILGVFHTHIASARCVLAILSAIRVMVSKPNKIRMRFMTDQSTGMSLAQLLNMALSHHMDPFPESNMVVLVCGTLNFLAFECVPHKNEIGRTGIFEQLGEMIDVSSRDANVVALQPSLAAVCTLVLNSKENQDRFMNMNGVQRILGLMEKWHRNPKVLEHCCIALRYSCNQHPGNCEDVKRLHGVKNLNAVMRSHHNNPRLFEMACLALAVLCQGDNEIQESPTVSEAIKATCEAMQNFPGDPVVQVAACTMFLSATFENEGNKRRVVRYGGRTAIVHALQSHPGHVELAEAGAYALLHVENVELPASAHEDLDDQRPTEGIRAFGRPDRRSGRLKKGSSQGRLSLSRRRSREVARDSPPVEEPVEEHGEQLADDEPAPRVSRTFSRRKKNEEQTARNAGESAAPSRSFLRFGRSRGGKKGKSAAADQEAERNVKEEAMHNAQKGIHAGGYGDDYNVYPNPTMDDVLPGQVDSRSGEGERVPTQERTATESVQEYYSMD